MEKHNSKSNDVKNYFDSGNIILRKKKRKKKTCLVLLKSNTYLVFIILYDFKSVDLFS